VTTIYIAGPMSGLPEFNYPAFFAAAEQLTAAGYDVLNPARPEGREGCSTWGLGLTVKPLEDWSQA